MTTPVGAIELVVEADMGAFAARTEAQVKATAGQLGRTMDAEMTSATTRAGQHGTNAGQAYTRGRDGKLRDSRGSFVKEADSHGAGAAAAMGKRGEQAGEQFSRGMMGKVGGIGGGITKLLNSALGTSLSGSAFAGAAIAGIGIASIKMAGDFETSMTRLVTAAGESKKALGMVSSGVLSIARDTGTSTTALASAMYMVESAGYHGAAALAVTRAAAEGAKVDMADTGVVANALTTAMTDMHAPTDKAATVMSQLVATVGHGKMTMDDLAGSLHSVLPNAAALGLNMGQVGGAIATMTAQGISAAQATQNLNHAILALAAPTAVQTKTMAAFGLNATTVAKNLGKLGLDGTLQELSRTITQHMGPAGLTITSALNTSQIAAGKANTMFANLSPAVQKLAGQVMSGTLPLKTFRKDIGGLSADQAILGRQWATSYTAAHGFSDLLKSSSPSALTYVAALSKMTGGQVGLQVALHLTGQNMAAYKQNIATINAAHAEAGNHVQDWAIKQKTFNQQMSQLKETIVTAVIAIGMRLLPILTTIVTWINAHLVPAVTTLIGWVRTLAGMLHDFYDAFRANPSLETFVGIIAGAVVIFKAYELAVRGVAFATALWRAIVLNAQVAMWLLNAAMDANPIGLLVLAIAGLAAGIVYAYTHFKTFHDIVDGIGRVFMAVLAPAFNFVRRLVTDVVGFIVAHWKWFAGILFTIMTGGLGPLVLLIVGNFDKIKRFVTGVFTAIAGFFHDHWRLLLTIFTGGLGLIWIVIQDHWKQISGFFTRMYVAIAGVVQRLWHDVVAYFTRLWREAEAIITVLWTRARDIFTRIWRDITTPVIRIWHDVVTYFTRLINAVWAIINPFWTRMLQGWANIRDKVVGVASVIWSKVTDFFGRLETAVKASVQGAVNGVKSIWDKIKDIIAAPIRFVVNTVYDHGIVPIWNAVAGILHENSLKLDPIHFAAGGEVPGRVSQGDNVPIMATRGEGVLNHTGMAAVGGAAGLTALNQSGPGGSHGAQGHYIGGGIIGGITNIVSAELGAAAGLARGGLAAGLTPAIQGFETLADIILNNMGGMGAIADKMVHAMGDNLIQFIRGDDLAYLRSIAGTVGADHAALIEKALQLAGVPITAGNVADVDMIVKFESGWNPNAINLTDSNARAGHPSQGLMQTIPSTFAAYTLPGFNNITDPIGNMIAGIRYAISRYGSLDAVPGVAAVHAGGAYVGYDTGGLLMPGYTNAYNGTGRPEHVIPGDKIDTLIAAVRAPKSLRVDRSSIATLVNDENRHNQVRRS